MSEEPQVLSYDKPNTASGRRSHWIIPGYCVGIQAASFIHAAIGYLILTRSYTDGFEHILYGILLPICFAFIGLLPEIIFLGLTLWLKRKIVREIRFSGFRGAFAWGFLGGLVPFPLFPVYQNSIGPLPDAAGFAMLGWLVLFPITAALFLCRHSHVRD